jgi:hypothetical protein
MQSSGTVVGVGGPIFTAWVSPTEEELRKKYNPDLLRKSIENRESRQEEFNHFVTKLKEYSKSDKPIWVVAKEAEERDRQQAIAGAKSKQVEAEARRQQLRKESGLE